VKVIAVALLGLVVLVSALAYSYLQPAPLASAPIESVTLQPPVAPSPDQAARVFEIVPTESEARFVIAEVLQGAPKTVVGTTSEVAGQIALDPSDLDTTQVGTILINARTFATDSSQRDRAIQNWVLNTAEHEYITFQPTVLLGLPDGASATDAVPLQIIGDLTIAGVTRPVTFDAIVTPGSTDRLEGSASTTIRYADWGLAIPQVPAVASVSDTVRLELDFAAQAAQGSA
jgi:polyisoprenoid-binding protein YceI